VSVRAIAGFLGRFLAAAVAAAVLTLLGLSFVRLIGENLAFYHRLRGLQSEVAVLRARADSDERTINRISDDRGAIPEIHDRLHVVGPHESIIYLKRVAR
jgi:hypothetical protein